MPFVVEVGVNDRSSPETRTENLVAIRYDRYQRGETNTHLTTPDIKDAFHFKTSAAAEMAAVFVGGTARGIKRPK